MEKLLLKTQEDYDRFIKGMSNTWPLGKYPPKSYPAVVLFTLSPDDESAKDYLTYGYVYPEDFSD